MSTFELAISLPNLGDDEGRAKARTTKRVRMRAPISRVGANNFTLSATSKFFQFWMRRVV